MDFNRYCKHCNGVIEFEYGESVTTCPHCGTEIKRADTIPGFTRDARAAQLKAMHDIMCEANDENIYMTWINVVPDCATPEDFIDIAMDEEMYNEAFDLFVRLIQKKGNRW